MFRFFALRKGKPGGVVVIGLSAENLRRLQNGEPILRPLADWRPPPGVALDECDVLIQYGETEEAISAEWTRASRRAFQGRFRRR